VDLEWKPMKRELWPFCLDHGPDARKVGALASRLNRRPDAGLQKAAAPFSVRPEERLFNLKRES